MKTSLLTVFFLSALLVQTIGYAADNPAYTCRWHFIRQCGTGHAGGVEFIQEDDSGNIWTGAGSFRSSSLWRFDGKQWQQRYTVGRKGNSLHSAAYRKNDGLYVATDQGLLHVRNDRLVLNTQMYIVHGFGPSLFYYVGNATFNAVPTKLVYLDKRDDLWVYAPNIGLFRHTGGIWNEHTTYWPQDGGRTKLINLLDDIIVTSFHAVNRNSVVVGGSTGNVFFLKEKTSSYGGRGTDIELVTRHTAKTIGIPEGARISSITSDPEGCVWIAYGKGDADGGVACLRENECEVFSHMNSDIPKRPITAIACLPNGRIMAGVDWNDPTVGGAPQGVTYDKTGLLEFVAGKWQFVEVEGFSASAGRVIDHGPDEPKEVALYNESYRWINFIWPDSRGNIWVGTQAGLARFAPVKRRQTARKGTQPATAADDEDAIGFEVFAGFKRIEKGNPIIALEPPLWAAATHAIVVDEMVHYIWCKRELGRRWLMMHATAPVGDLTDITQDARNPILIPSEKGFDDEAVEYPFPFLNPADDKFYMYYRGKGKTTPEQTGLLVSDGDMGKWTRVRSTPVIAADTEHERDGSTHPSVAVVGDTIHIVYTGKATRSYEDGLTMCHATAPTSDPASVTKDPANPVFKGSGQAWDSRAVREAELFKGPRYFHILYGGYDGKVWRIGHVRTRDFRTFEPNPHNPVFTPSASRDAWDCDGVLTPQVIEIGETYYMVYAGKKGKEWQTGLAKIQKP